jgi:hypothetical protein
MLATGPAGGVTQMQTQPDKHGVERHVAVLQYWAGGCTQPHHIGWSWPYPDR